jgi:hypothetical protein
MVTQGLWKFEGQPETKIAIKPKISTSDLLRNKYQAKKDQKPANQPKGNKPEDKPVTVTDGEPATPANTTTLPVANGSTIDTLLPRTEDGLLDILNAAIINFGSDSSIDKEQQIEENREAKRVVKKRLEQEGYIFPEDYLDQFSVVRKVTKNGEEYPLVVKSYKYDKAPFKIAANEWIHLLNPNAMFWVHFGQGELRCLKLFDLLRDQPQMSISFSTENLDSEKRIGQFAEMLHFFKDVHFDISKFNISNTTDRLKDYRFDARRTEKDINDNNPDVML